MSNRRTIVKVTTTRTGAATKRPRYVGDGEGQFGKGSRLVRREECARRYTLMFARRVVAWRQADGYTAELVMIEEEPDGK